MVAGGASCVSGIDDFQRRLAHLEDCCGGNPGVASGEANSGNKDEFLRLKDQLYGNLSLVKAEIRERQALQRRSGNTFDVIHKGVAITDYFKQIDLDFRRAQDVYRKQSTQRRKFTEADLEKRFETLSIMKRQIEEARLHYRTGGVSGRIEEGDVADDMNVVSHQRERLGIAKQRPDGESSRRGNNDGEGPTEEEEQAMERWREKDEELDNEIDEIGKGVERLGEIASQINQTADKQIGMAQEIQKTAEKATQELNQMNVKLKKVMESQKNGLFFCRIFLVVILMAFVGYLYNVLSK